MQLIGIWFSKFRFDNNFSPFSYDGSCQLLSLCFNYYHNEFAYLRMKILVNSFKSAKKNLQSRRIIKIKDSNPTLSLN